jgi:hypothetical protein
MNYKIRILFNWFLFFYLIESILGNNYIEELESEKELQKKINKDIKILDNLILDMVRCENNK